MRISRLGSLVCLVALAGTSCRQEERYSPEASVELIVRSIDKQDAEALWRYLPVSMKSEFAALVRGSRRDADPRLTAVSDLFLTEAGEALSGQESLFSEFSPLRDGMKDARDRQAFAQGLAATLRVLASRGLLGGASRIEDTLDRLGPSVLRLMVPALRASGSTLLEPWRPGPFQLTAPSAGKVTYTRRAADGRSVSAALVLVEGRWIPEQWMIAWQGIVKAAQQLLQTGPVSPLASHKLQVIRLLNQTRARLPRLAKARDQEGFDKALSLVVGSLSLAMKWATTAPLGS